MPKSLDAETVITQGGWHPRYALVLLILEADDEALVLVDSNGDGAEVESEQWRFTDDGWAPGVSTGIGPLESDPLWSWGWHSGSGYAVGRAAPGRTVTVEWHGETREAVANEQGIWGTLFPGQSPPPDPVAEFRGTFGWFLGNERANARVDRPRIVEDA